MHCRVGEDMSWAAILTLLAMAAATAFLVLAKGWAYIKAFGAVVGVMFSFIAVLSGILYLPTPHTECPLMWDQAIKVMRQDLQGLIDLLTGKPKS